MKDVINEIKGKDEIQKMYLFLCRNSGLRIAEISNQLIKHNQLAEYKLSPNSFRHYYATNYLRNMLDTKTTMEHASINMTSKYIEANKIEL